MKRFITSSTAGFRKTDMLHRPKVELKLKLFRFAKLLHHNSALYHSLHTQFAQKDVLHRVLGAITFRFLMGGLAGAKS